jgi:purine nucleosidase
LPIDIIQDGDHGGDDFIATLVFALWPEIFNLLGITTVQGNGSAERSARNALSALDLANRTEIPVAVGQSKPLIIPLKEGDDAFSSNGIGGANLQTSSRDVEKDDAVTWLYERLQSAEKSVTLCLTGTMTNIAILLQKHPEIHSKIERIIAMGGCVGPLKPYGRFGNITQYAEFNFYMDPDAAHYVLNSGIPVTLLPMDVTNQLIFTPERQNILREKFSGSVFEELIKMMRSAEKFDFPNFDFSGAVVHDPTVAYYLIAPHLFSGEKVTLNINCDADDKHHGQLTIDKYDEGHVHLIDQMIDPDAAFQLLIETFLRLKALKS